MDVFFYGLISLVPGAALFQAVRFFIYFKNLNLRQCDLATELVIAPLTVKKAYDVLEQEGLIVTQRGRGTFVSDDLPAVEPAEMRERLRDAAQQLLSQAALIGLPFSEVLALLRELREGMKR